MSPPLYVNPQRFNPRVVIRKLRQAEIDMHLAKKPVTSTKHCGFKQLRRKKKNFNKLMKLETIDQFMCKFESESIKHFDYNSSNENKNNENQEKFWEHPNKNYEDFFKAIPEILSTEKNDVSMPSAIRNRKNTPVKRTPTVGTPLRAPLSQSSSMQTTPLQRIQTYSQESFPNNAEKRALQRSSLEDLPSTMQKATPIQSTSEQKAPLEKISTHETSRCETSFQKTFTHSTSEKEKLSVGKKILPTQTSSALTTPIESKSVPSATVKIPLERISLSDIPALQKTFTKSTTVTETSLRKTSDGHVSLPKTLTSKATLELKSSKYAEEISLSKEVMQTSSPPTVQNHHNSNPTSNFDFKENEFKSFKTKSLDSGCSDNESDDYDSDTTVILTTDYFPDPAENNTNDNFHNASPKRLATIANTSLNESKEGNMNTTLKKAKRKESICEDKVSYKRRKLSTDERDKLKITREKDKKKAYSCILMNSSSKENINSSDSKHSAKEKLDKNPLTSEIGKLSNKIKIIKNIKIAGGIFDKTQTLNSSSLKLSQETHDTASKKMLPRSDHRRQENSKDHVNSVKSCEIKSSSEVPIQKLCEDKPKNSSAVKNKRKSNSRIDSLFECDPLHSDKSVSSPSNNNGSVKSVKLSETLKDSDRSRKSNKISGNSDETVKFKKSSGYSDRSVKSNNIFKENDETVSAETKIKDVKITAPINSVREENVSKDKASHRKSSPSSSKKHDRDKSRHSERKDRCEKDKNRHKYSRRHSSSSSSSSRRSSTSSRRLSHERSHSGEKSVSYGHSNHKHINKEPNNETDNNETLSSIFSEFGKMLLSSLVSENLSDETRNLIKTSIGLNSIKNLTNQTNTSPNPAAGSEQLISDSGSNSATVTNENNNSSVLGDILRYLKKHVSERTPNTEVETTKVTNISTNQNLEINKENDDKHDEHNILKPSTNSEEINVSSDQNKEIIENEKSKLPNQIENRNTNSEDNRKNSIEEISNSAISIDSTTLENKSVKKFNVQILNNELLKNPNVKLMEDKSVMPTIGDKNLSNGIILTNNSLNHSKDDSPENREITTNLTTQSEADIIDLTIIKDEDPDHEEASIRIRSSLSLGLISVHDYNLILKIIFYLIEAIIEYQNHNKKIEMYKNSKYDTSELDKVIEQCNYDHRKNMLKQLGNIMRVLNGNINILTKDGVISSIFEETRKMKLELKRVQVENVIKALVKYWKEGMEPMRNSINKLVKFYTDQEENTRQYSNSIQARASEVIDHLKKPVNTPQISSNVSQNPVQGKNSVYGHNKTTVTQPSLNMPSFENMKNQRKIRQNSSSNITGNQVESIENRNVNNSNIQSRTNNLLPSTPSQNLNRHNPNVSNHQTFWKSNHQTNQSDRSQLNSSSLQTTYQNLSNSNCFINPQNQSYRKYPSNFHQIQNIRNNQTMVPVNYPSITQENVSTPLQNLLNGNQNIPLPNGVSYRIAPFFKTNASTTSDSQRSISVVQQSQYSNRNMTSQTPQHVFPNQRQIHKTIPTNACQSNQCTALPMYPIPHLDVSNRPYERFPPSYPQYSSQVQANQRYTKNLSQPNVSQSFLNLPTNESGNLSVPHSNVSNAIVTNNQSQQFLNSEHPMIPQSLTSLTVSTSKDNNFNVLPSKNRLAGNSTISKDINNLQSPIFGISSQNIQVQSYSTNKNDYTTTTQNLPNESRWFVQNKNYRSKRNESQVLSNTSQQGGSEETDNSAQTIQQSVIRNNPSHHYEDISSDSENLSIPSVEKNKDANSQSLSKNQMTEEERLKNTQKLPTQCIILSEENSNFSVTFNQIDVIPKISSPLEILLKELEKSQTPAPIDYANKEHLSNKQVHWVREEMLKNPETLPQQKLSNNLPITSLSVTLKELQTTRERTLTQDELKKSTLKEIPQNQAIQDKRLGNSITSSSCEHVATSQENSNPLPQLKISEISKFFDATEKQQKPAEANKSDNDRNLESDQFEKVQQATFDYQAPGSQKSVITKTFWDLPQRFPLGSSKLPATETINTSIGSNNSQVSSNLHHETSSMENTTVSYTTGEDASFSTPHKKTNLIKRIHFSDLSSAHLIISEESQSSIPTPHAVQDPVENIPGVQSLEKGLNLCFSSPQKHLQTPVSNLYKSINVIQKNSLEGSNASISRVEINHFNISTISHAENVPAVITRKTQTNKRERCLIEVPIETISTTEILEKHSHNKINNSHKQERIVQTKSALSPSSSNILNESEKVSTAITLNASLENYNTVAEQVKLSSNDIQKNVNVEHSTVVNLLTTDPTEPKSSKSDTHEKMSDETNSCVISSQQENSDNLQLSPFLSKLNDSQQLNFNPPKSSYDLTEIRSDSMLGNHDTFYSISQKRLLQQRNRECLVSHIPPKLTNPVCNLSQHNLNQSDENSNNFPKSLKNFEPLHINTSSKHSPSDTSKSKNSGSRKDCADQPEICSNPTSDINNRYNFDTRTFQQIFEKSLLTFSKQGDSADLNQKRKENPKKYEEIKDKSEPYETNIQDDSEINRSIKNNTNSANSKNDKTDTSSPRLKYFDSRFMKKRQPIVFNINEYHYTDKSSKSE